MAIQYIGGGVGVSSAEIPLHSVGDIIIAGAFRSNSNTIPVLPSGWVEIASGFGNQRALMIAYKFASSTSDIVEEFTGANNFVAHVYRGVSPQPIGEVQQMTSGTAIMTFPALTLQNSSGSSWVVGIGGISAGGQAVEIPPAGMVNRTNRAVSGNEIVGHDTDGGVTEFTQRTGGGTGGVQYRTVAFELKQAAQSSDTVGQLVYTLSPLTGASNGSSDIVGGLSGELDSMLVSSSGELFNSGSLESSLLPLSVLSFGTSEIGSYGELSVTLEGLSVVSYGQSERFGYLEYDFQPMSAMSSGSELGPGEGSSNVTFEALTVDALSALDIKASVGYSLSAMSVVARGMGDAQESERLDRTIVVSSQIRFAFAGLQIREIKP